jgi:hypothetical protein
MVRSVDTIRKEIDVLKAETKTLAAEFDRLYIGYLDVLGQAIRRHLTIATYQLCTQIYPESFLALSVRQREKLQQGIRKIGIDVKTELLQLMSPPEVRTPQIGDLLDPDLSLPQGMVLVDSANFDGVPNPDAQPASPMATAMEDSQEAETVGDAPETEADVEALPTLAEETGQPATEEFAVPPMDPKTLIESVLMAAVSGDLGEGLRGRPFSGEDLTPTLVAKQHLLLEHQLRDVLQRASKTTNALLRAASIIPNLPEAVLDAASEAENAVDSRRSAPNLLNVMVEMSADVEADFDDDDDDDMEDDIEDDDDLDEASMGRMMTHLAAINLRLADLEFADVPSSMWRSKLRTALGCLRKLGKQYQKAEREFAIAEAEQAWRAVWYDDSSE